MRKFYLFLFAIASILIPSLASAQCNPVIANDSLQFLPNGTVNCTEISGNIMYLGGAFTAIGQNTGHFIGLDTLTGKTVNRGSYPRTNGNVYKAIGDGAGGWIIGGQFTKVGDSVRNNIAQIDASGHVTGFNPAANNAVYALLFNGSTLYVGGAFTTITGVARQRIAAINFTTGIATTWNPQANNNVYDIYIYNDRMYVGGKFTTIGGQSRNYIASVDMATGLANSLNANIGFYSDYMVRTIGGNAGKLYIGGRFYMVGGDVHACIAAIDTATGLAATWNPSAADSVNKIIFNGANAFIAGGFDMMGSVTRHGIAEVSLSTGLPTAFNPLLAGASSPYVGVSDMILTGGKLYIGGSFTSVYGTEKNRLAIIYPATGTVSSWNGDADALVHTLALGNSSLYAGGAFTMMGTKQRNRAAAIDLAADTITAWNPNVSGGVVNCIAVGTSAVYLGGTFYSVGSTTHNSVAAVDPITGTAATVFNTNPVYGSGFSTSTIDAMAFSNGILYMAGNFDYINGSSREHLGAVNASGAVTGWNPNSTTSSYGLIVNKMIVYGSDVYIGGNFALTIGGQFRSYAAAINTFSGLATAWNPNPDGQVTALAANGGKIYVGGNFNNIGGAFAPRLVRVSPATGVADSWNPFPDNTVSVIEPFQNISFISGSFLNVNGQPRQYFTSVDTITNVPSAFAPAPGGGSSINDMAVYNDRLYVGGYFYTISGQYDYQNLIMYKILSIADNISIAGNDTMCAGTSATYTATTNVVGGSYQWYVNNVPVGTGASTYTYTPTNGDQVKCTNYIPTGSCYTTDSATSNIITVTVNPYITPVVTISGPASACAGTAVTDTAHTTIVGAIYEWRVNAFPVGTAATYSYIPVNGDIITATITTPVGCYTAPTAISNTIAMTVNANLDPLTGITADATTVCASTAVAYHAHGINGLSYQWKVNGVNAGPNDSTYTYTPASGDNIYCIAAAPASGCYLHNPDTSLHIIMTVNPDTTPVITIIGYNSLCVGMADTFMLVSNVPGATYRWYVNGAAAPSTSTFYLYTPTNADLVTAVLTVPTNGCFTATTDTSNVINITTVTNVIPVSTITASANGICAGTHVTYTGTTNITGATYSWQVNGTGMSAGTTYNYTPANGDVVRLVLTSPMGSCYTQPMDTSNAVSMSVNAHIVPTIIVNGPGTVSPGNAVSISATVGNAGTGYLITWYKNGVVFNTSSTPSASYVKSVGLVDTITATVASLSAGCYDTTISNTIYVYGTVGVDNVSAHTAVTVYPNPFTNQVILKGAAVNDHVTLFDVVGRKMYETIITTNADTTLDIADIAPGMYLLRIADADGNNVNNITLQKK